VSVSQGDIHSKFTWQNFIKNILETELLHLSNPEKSVVSAGKLSNTGGVYTFCGFLRTSGCMWQTVEDGTIITVEW